MTLLEASSALLTLFCKQQAAQPPALDAAYAYGQALRRVDEQFARVEDMRHIRKQMDNRLKGLTTRHQKLTKTQYTGTQGVTQ